MAVDLSIVIPAYNESLKIRDDILAAGEFLRVRNLSGEILVVDDGSTDGTAAQARQTRVPDPTALHVTTLAAHKGKGFAVRAGVLASCGQVVAFVDSGRCVPYSMALPAIEWVKEGTCQIAIGSRKMPAQPHRSGAALAPEGLFGDGPQVVVVAFPDCEACSDTQCGFKFYSGPIARELFAESVIDGFLFDVEILVRAIRKGYIRAPVPSRVDL